MEFRSPLAVRTAVVFNEIFAINARLKHLGIQAEFLVEETKQMCLEYGEEWNKELVQFDNIASKAKIGVLGGEEQRKCSQKICRYWNKGYCREGSTKCAFYHPPDDCQQHLQEGRCSSKRCGLRHRKICKFWNTNEGCFRQGLCQYLHKDDPANVTKDKETEVEKAHSVKRNSFEEEGKESMKDTMENIEQSAVTEAPTKHMDKECVEMIDNNTIKVPTVSGEALSKLVEKESEEAIRTNSKQLSCALCKYKCKNKNILEKHMDSKHDGYKQCYMCESIFPSAETLKTHEDMHTDDEMFAALQRICDNATRN